MESFTYKIDADIVKDEGKNRFSRDTDILASGSGKVVVGTILGQIDHVKHGASGKDDILRQLD